MRLARTQTPDQVTIDRARAQSTLIKKRLSIGCVIQEPFELCCRKIGVENQTTARFYERLLPFGLQVFTDIGCPTALPDNCVMNGFTCLCVPKNSSLALIRDTDCRYICSIVGPISADRRQPFFDRLPNGLRIMFNPTGLGENLRKLMVHRGQQATVGIHERNGRARGALIYCKY